MDDRNGTVKKLSPSLYRAIIDEAHKHDLRVIVHVYYLADARDLVDAGADGFLHLVRDEEMDDALVESDEGEARVRHAESVDERGGHVHEARRHGSTIRCWPKARRPR